MADKHYCRGDDLLAMERETLPTDKDGRIRPGYHVYLKRREQYDAEHAEDN